MRMIRSMMRLCLLAAAAVLFAACASPASREGMTPSAAVTKQHPYAVRVMTAGGAETGALDSSNISNADMKAAIEVAITQNKLFRAIIQDSSGADYELSVTVISLSKPLFGGTFTVAMEAAWSLTRASDRGVVMRKSIKSSGVATMGDAFAGVTRLRMAVERAASDNISQGLNAIAESQL